MHDGKFYLSLYWTDEGFADRSDDSVLVVVAVATDTVEGTISANCPGLKYATVDDAGQLHFSNWTGGPGTYFVLGTAQNCIASINPATREVTTRTFASIANGHEGAAFEYAGNGQFVMSIFDEVRADAANADEPFGMVGGTNWQLWTYDSATDEAAPIEAVDWNSGAPGLSWREAQRTVPATFWLPLLRPPLSLMTSAQTVPPRLARDGAVSPRVLPRRSWCVWLPKHSGP